MAISKWLCEDKEKKEKSSNLRVVGPHAFHRNLLRGIGKRLRPLDVGRGVVAAMDIVMS